MVCCNVLLPPRPGTWPMCVFIVILRHVLKAYQNSEGCMNIHIYTDLYTYGTPKKSRVAFIRIFAYIRICHIYYIYIYPKKISEVKDLKSWNTCDFLHPVGFKVLQDGWFFSTGSRRMTDHLHSFAWWQLLNRENSVLVGSRSFV